MRFTFYPVTDLATEIEDCICRQKLLRQGQTVVVAVSGGSDSMVLLHIVHRLSKQHGWKVKVAHLNHRLRGRQSGADERLVKRIARRLSLPIVARRADVRAFAHTRKISLEMAARQLRHSFLASVAREACASTVALAHHADDQLELFFLRLLRGSGGDGLTGMKWRNPSPADASIELVRPLLGKSKAALSEYARSQKISFREDSTNASLDFQRNRIRHELLPLLRKSYQPALETVISRMIDITSSEAEFASAAGARWLSALKEPLKPVSRQARQKPSRQAQAQVTTAFDQLPIAVQRRCLQAQLLELRVTPEFELIEHLRLQPGTPICVSVEQNSARGNKSPPSRILLRSPAGLLSFVQPEPSFSDSGSLELSLDKKAGQVTFEDINIIWYITSGKKGRVPGPTPGVEVFDADRVGPRISLRHWRAGDRFQPIGMSGSVKVQDFLTNQKIPRRRRHVLALGVSSAGEVFWLEGQRISERFKLTENTNRRLHWAWQRL